MKKIVERARTLRRFVWHLRRGGVGQASTFRYRHALGGEGFANAPLRRPGRGLVWFRPHRLRIDELSTPEVRPSKPEVHVGVILDDFSLAGFEWEWTCTQLVPAMGEEQIRELKLDFILIESAWNGNRGLWRYKLTGSNGPGPEVVHLIATARRLNIPVVMWNKEDPPHYLDFLPLARLCDHIFTTDSNMIDRYKLDLGHSRISCLPFAAQPRIHNPVRPRHGWREGDIAFAGMYFSHKFAERRDQMRMLLGAAAKAASIDGYRFDIYSRQSGRKAEYRFPDDLQRHVLGSLNYSQMLNAYKRYKMFLNVNSVVNSPTMCSRRVFEMTAAGALVVTTPSPAMSSLFSPDELCVVGTAEEAVSTIRAMMRNLSFADRMVHRAQRRIWREHTYRHRADQILSAVGHVAQEEIPAPKVSVIVSSIRPEQLDHVVAGIGAQRGVQVELVYGAHGFEVDATDFQQKCDVAGIASSLVVNLPAQHSLGECLNALVECSSSEYVAKWDDDDVYGEWYLWDQLQALSFSEASVVGKRAHYMQLQGLGAIVLRNAQFEHRYTHFVAGPTLLAKKSVFLSHPFAPVSNGEDTKFLHDVISAGGAVYAADRFNYCQVRSSNAQQHTWKISEANLMSTSDVMHFGQPLTQISV